MEANRFRASPALDTEDFEMAIPRDHTIASHVRAVLDRMWIDPGHVDFGSVNGVVYIRGELRRQPPYPQSGAAGESGTLTHVLRRALGAIDGVKDVSLDVMIQEDEDDPCSP